LRRRADDVEHAHDLTNVDAGVVGGLQEVLRYLVEEEARRRLAASEGAVLEVGDEAGDDVRVAGVEAALEVDGPGPLAEIDALRQAAALGAREAQRLSPLLRS